MNMSEMCDTMASLVGMGLFGLLVDFYINFAGDFTSNKLSLLVIFL